MQSLFGSLILGYWLIRFTLNVEIDFMGESIFVQQYVPNPLLIDNR